jgi:hypothetical protein
MIFIDNSDAIIVSMKAFKFLYFALSVSFVESFVLPLRIENGLACSSPPPAIIGQQYRGDSTKGTGSTLFYSATELLYQDQQNAMENRALYEETLLKKGKELKASKIRTASVKGGTGFGGGASVVDPNVQMAIAQTKVLNRDGVIRIDQALSSDVADKLREHILQQKDEAASITEQDASKARALYGVENQRASRCDLQLSLLGNFGTDNGAQNHVMADTLQDLLGKEGSLRHIYENLVTLQGEFYELAAVVTDPGSTRQKIHPDLPYKVDAPLYVVFLALQDVNEAMGPTSFLLKTHTSKENAKFSDPSQEVRDKQISSSEHRLSTLKKGDAVIFDARILHCGNANDSENGSTRALFNFSFRNPKVTADLGYAGSIRPRYVKSMNLQDISDALAEYEKNGGEVDPFLKYGNGIE